MQPLTMALNTNIAYIIDSLSAAVHEPSAICCYRALVPISISQQLHAPHRTGGSSEGGNPVAIAETSALGSRYSAESWLREFNVSDVSL